MEISDVMYIKEAPGFVRVESSGDIKRALDICVHKVNLILRENRGNHGSPSSIDHTLFDCLLHRLYMERGQSPETSWFDPSVLRWIFDPNYTK